jgi:hypothetical protein
MYSPENYSLFASYDDGYIVVIYLTNFKLEHYRMSTSQIYTMDIMTNHNILIFGGVEEKILFSQVINLNKILLFYDSKEGEVQSILYDEKRDILVAAFRKNCVIFFKYGTSDIIYKYEFENKKDACGMVLKKNHEGDNIFVCGFFMNLHQFRINDNDKIEYVQYINLQMLHLYDFLKLNDLYCIVTTYDEAKLLLVDLEDKKIVKTFNGFKGAIQVKMIKNSFYITSHSECLKKVNFKLK